MTQTPRRQQGIRFRQANWRIRNIVANELRKGRTGRQFRAAIPVRTGRMRRAYRVRWAGRKAIRVGFGSRVPYWVYQFIWRLRAVKAIRRAYRLAFARQSGRIARAVFQEKLDKTGRALRRKAARTFTLKKLIRLTFGSHPLARIALQLL